MLVDCITIRLELCRWKNPYSIKILHGNRTVSLNRVYMDSFEALKDDKPKSLARK